MQKDSGPRDETGRPTDVAGQVHVYSKDESVMDLKNRLTESERLQKEYIKTISAMKVIQDHQSKALEALSSETDFPGKIKALENDLRIAKEQNTQIKKKLYDTERSNQRMHMNMVELE